MILSKRLTTIASFVPKGSVVADVGCDHGYIPIYLVKNQVASRAIAMDVRTGPLSRAQEHVQEYGLQEQIELRLSDGMDALEPGEVNAVVISGLGGPLMVDILTRGSKVAETVDCFVLSPQSDIPGVRVFLREHGYRICKEAFLQEDGKYYTVMQVVHGKETPGRYIDDLYGKYLLDQGDPVLRAYLQREAGKYRQLLPALKQSPKEETRARAQQMEAELQQMEQALRIMEE